MMKPWYVYIKLTFVEKAIPVGEGHYELQISQVFIYMIYLFVFGRTKSRAFPEVYCIFGLFETTKAMKAISDFWYYVTIYMTFLLVLKLVVISRKGVNQVHELQIRLPFVEDSTVCREGYQELNLQ